MTLVVLSVAAMRRIEEAIASASHMLTDTNGEKVSVGTIDSRALKTAAVLAVQIATNQVIWPGDERLRIAAPKPVAGVVEIG